MSRQCQCGGTIVIGQLTEGRSSWRCQSCGRYEIVEPHTTTRAEVAADKDDFLGFFDDAPRAPEPK